MSLSLVPTGSSCSHIVYTFNPKLILLSVAAAQYYACDQGVYMRAPCALSIYRAAALYIAAPCGASLVSSRKRITPHPTPTFKYRSPTLYMQYQTDAPRFKLAVARQSQASRN